MDVTTQETKEPTPQETKEVLLTDIEINDPNTALNVLVSFVNLANKRANIKFFKNPTINNTHILNG